jgi:UDP-glucose 4-epimerase
VAKLIGGDYVYVDPRPGDPRSTMADITLIKKLLDWHPTITLEDGIAELKKEWRL